MRDLAQSLQLAVHHHQTGQLQQAKAIYAEILRVYPNHADVLNLLGVIAGQTEQYSEALALISRAIEINSAVPDYHNNLGKVLQGLGRIEAAIDCYRKALDLRGDHVDALFNLGNALMRQRQFEAAVSCFEKVLRIAPDYADAHNNLGQALQEQGKIDAAVSAYQTALQINPNNATYHCNVGLILEKQGKIEEAISYYERTLQIAPDNVNAHNNLGNALSSLGKRDAAIISYKNALHHKPDHSLAHYNLALIENHDSVNHEYIHRVESLLEVKDLEDKDAMHLHFALGKIYDDCGAYDKAFAHYRRGNKIKRKTIEFDANALEDLVSRLMRTFTREFFQERMAFQNSSDIPVFIVGMPRSGTTLVEQIIASHPQVYGAGELIYFLGAPTMIPKQLQSSLPYPDCVTLIDEVTCHLLAEGYLSFLSTQCSTALRITDKLPSNFLNLGLISLVFPNAHIIHCQRHPLDTCLSIYTQNFETTIAYAYELSEIGDFYRQYARLMAYWGETISVPILDVSYEKLVQDQDPISHQIIEFLGLDWDDHCLSFYKTDRPVRTASAWQVRQPIYSHSIGRWKHYEAFLGPLKEQLGIENGGGD
jgi:tetratricopeptide (TPR) repeat protein